jgi:hypothetical protein
MKEREGPIDPRFYREPPMDMTQDGWASDRNRAKPRGKYPRKLWFGLTDYGPPKMTWPIVISAILAKIVFLLLL